MKITRTRGDTFADRFFITANATGAAYNLSGCSFKMTLNTKQNPSDSDLPTYQLTGTIGNPLEGVVEFAPSASQANQLGEFFFDVQMTDSTGAIRTLVLDSYTYTQDITK